MLSTLTTTDVLAKTEGTIRAWSSVAELDLEKKLAVQVICQHDTVVFAY